MIGGLRVAVVVPCYRASAQVAGVLRRMPPAVDRVFVVDDASPEDDARRAESVGDPRVRVLRHGRNLGVGGAVVSGYKASLEEGFDVIVKCDGDGQMDPELIPVLVSPLLEGDADHAKGCRFHHADGLSTMPWARLWGNAALSFLVKVASGYWHVVDPVNGFLATRATALSRLPLDSLSRRYFFESDLLIRLNIIEARVADVPIASSYGREKSSLSIGKVLLEFPGKLLTGLARRVFWRYVFFNVSPVGVFALLGVPLTAFGVLFGGWQWAVHAARNTNTPLGTIMLAAVPVLLGAQLLLQAMVLDVQNSPRPTRMPLLPYPTWKEADFSRPAGRLRMLAASGCILFCVIAAVFQARYVAFRPDVVNFYSRFMVPWALGHAAVLLFLQARGGRSNAFNGMYFALSFLGLLALGGTAPIREAAALSVFVSAVFLTGLPAVRALFDDDRSRLFLSAPAGFALWIALGSWIGTAGLFHRGLLAGLLAAGAAAGLISSRKWISNMVSRAPDALRNKTSVASLLAVEWLFLLSCFLAVGARAPETHSDAVRGYWPFIRLWLAHGGFFNHPSWAFTAPQAGVVYGAFFSALTGNAVRQAMPLAWLFLVGVVVGRREKAPFALSVSFAAVLAGTPLLLWCSKCLMTDVLGILQLVLLAVVVVSGDRARPALFGGAAGFLGGVAWVCKTSSVAYVGALLLAALFEIRRDRPRLPVLFITASSVAAGFLAASGPWLIHAYRLSGNPFFPYLSRFFPSPLWPNGLGLANLRNFAFKSLGDWFLWPWRVTFHADRFAEGLPGFLGMSVPLAAVLFLFHKSEDRTRTWWILMLTAVVGTLALWRYTSYLRYWMPGLWLAYLALQPGLARWSRSGYFKGLCAAAAGVIVFFQVPSTMATLWKDPLGWPWDYHRRTISEKDYLERAYPGLEGLRRELLGGAGWDDIVLLTGFQGPGHLPPCIPVEMHLWELRLHAQDLEGQTAYIRNMAPSYWIMNRESKDAQYFFGKGVGSRFLTPERLVGQSGPYDIYRLKRNPS